MGWKTDWKYVFSFPCSAVYVCYVICSVSSVLFFNTAVASRISCTIFIGLYVYLNGGNELGIRTVYKYFKAVRLAE